MTRTGLVSALFWFSPTVETVGYDLSPVTGLTPKTLFAQDFLGDSLQGFTFDLTDTFACQTE